MLAATPALARRRCSSGSRWSRPRSSSRGRAGSGRSRCRRPAARPGRATSSAQGRQRLVDVGPHPLAQRPLGPGLAALLRRRQPAVGEQPQHLRLDRDLREPLADQRVLASPSARPPARSSATCTRACSANASPARSCISVVIATRQPLSTPPTTFSTGIRASSMNSSLNSASPVIWTSGRISTPVLLHVHQEVGEPAVLGRVRVRAREQHAPLGVMGERRPHLLAGHDVRVAVQHRAGLQRRQVRARLRLARTPGTRSRRRAGSAPGTAPSARPSRAR